jgi:DNA-binding NtrC family response regulator
VDDEPEILAGIRRSLRREPYEILEATSPREALEVLRRRSVEVVVSDERMPGGSGAALLQEIRTLYPAAIRILLTGEVGLGSTMRILEECALYRLLTKPVSPEELVRTLRQAVRMHQLENARAHFHVLDAASSRPGAT